MKTKITYLSLFMLLLASVEVHAQAKLGDNPTDVNPNVLLELESSDKGLLIPRLTTSQRDTAFTADVPEGLIIYNTTEDCLQVYSNALWNCLSGTSGGAMTLDGNILHHNGGSVDLTALLASSGLTVATGDDDTAVIQLGTSAITLKEGSNINLTESGNTITIAADGGVKGLTGATGVAGPVGPQGPAASNTDNQALTFNPTTGTVTKTTIALTNGGALSLQTSGSLTFTHTGPDTLEIHAPTAGHLQQVEEAGKNGYRILNSDSDNHGDIGEKALDLSYQELLPNLPNKIKRETSTVKGSPSTGATGTNSTAIGVGTTASGNTSTAMGNGTNATGYFSTAMGDYTTAESYGQTTIGMNNTTLAGSTTVFDANDRLFVIGNGESVTKESDALVILENGDTRLNGALTVSGTISTPGTVHHPDYVFERYYEEVSEYNKSYSLPSLSEIEVFVKANKHLPGVQSRSDIKEKGSWNITENVRTNLEKVEELYLHAIAQEKKIDAQSKVIEQLILRLDALEKKE